MSEKETACLRDITETDIMEYMQVEHPHNEKELWKMKHATPARIGIGRCGARYTTEAQLLRPDWGREFLPDARQKIAENCVHHPQVQIYFGDGLCSPSIKANIPDLFPTIKMGLEDKGITVGTPFFVRYCRVNTARTIGPLLDAEVTCVLIGERPGLLTSESMSAYIAYHARPDMLESEYTVVSNISRHGVPPVEAAAHIADLIAQILEKKKSGVEFSKAE